MPRVADITEFLNQFAPLSLAAEWDNVGLLMGDPSASVQKIMTCLTVTPQSAGEAVESQVNLIVSHHPILFRATRRLTTATAEGRMLLSLTQAGVAVYSPHTAFDNCTGGINDFLAHSLGLTEVRPLRDQDGPRQCKIVVFVPDQDLAKVSDALFAAGAGYIGEYSECSFRLPGTGTFFGSDASNPTVGAKGRREEVNEWRLEAICPEAILGRVVAAMRRAHSYEEPAYDVYPLRPERMKVGIGRLGKLSAPKPLADFAANVKNLLKAGGIQMVGDPQRKIQQVAIVCGAGGEFVSDAVSKNADALLTGEARFHDALAAQAQGLALVLPGHYASERIGVESLAERLQRAFPDVKAWPSRRETDPLATV
jgi:dinuclear metal center YbgI/SA1388 family protein